MCGFAALFEQGRSFPSELCDEIDNDLHHRGPDSSGSFVKSGMAVVFRRLSILDPRGVSDQPMRDPSGRFVLVYNGELYNFRQLRRELEASGVVFRTTGDTEVLLQALMRWGEQALNRFEGMYALVFLDLHERTALAARDPLGIKPLYIARKGGFVGFASEMRPLTRLVGAECDPRALAELLVFRFAAGRMSNLKEIQRLPGGHWARLSLETGQLLQRQYCDARDELHHPDSKLTLAEAEAEAAHALSASVKDHLQSDVGFCLQLSGGIDSSLVAALSSVELGQPIRSFGINLSPAKNDESAWRQLIVEKYQLDHHEIRLTGLDYANALPETVRFMEGPPAHSGCVLLMLLCREIAKYNKVVLTGEGADEFFGGYMRYRQWRDLQRKGRLAALVPSFAWPLLDRWRDYRRFAGHPAEVYSAVQGDYLATNEIFPELVPGSGTREQIADEFTDFRSRLFAVDQGCYLESLLLRQDKLAMASSLEARVPYAHLPLGRVLNRFPHNLRAPGGETKPILKNLAARYLPDALIRRRKVGLTVPANDWLADERAIGRYFPLLTDADSRLSMFGNRTALRHAVDDFRAGKRHRLPPLDHLIGVEMWLRSLEPLRRQSTQTAIAA
jgi:asparagine synthase (glutamine-hydrolysing)